MHKTLLIIIALLIIAFVVSAQDRIPPPPGYNVTCEAQPILYTAFGPQCLNPVKWDMDGYHRIHTFVEFTYLGAPRMGYIRGFMWQPQENRYHYWITVIEFLDIQFVNVPPEQVVAQ